MLHIFYYWYFVSSIYDQYNNICSSSILSFICLVKQLHICPLQFGFQQKYSSSFSLIHLTEAIKDRHLMKENVVVVFLLICKKPLTLLITTF